MSFEDFKFIVKQLPTLKTLGLFFMGEPFLNPDIFKMIEYAENNQIETVMSTNSTTLGRHAWDILHSRLSRIIVCLDGLTQKTLETYRKGSSFKQLMAGIEHLARLKTVTASKWPHITLRFLVFKHNEHEIPGVLSLAKQLRINKVCLGRAVLDWNKKSLSKDVAKNWLPRDARFSRYVTNGNGYALDSPIKCTWIWKPIITWNGDVIPCCLDIEATHKIGNIHDEPLQKIFWSKRYFTLRIQMARKSLDICEYCKAVAQTDVEFFF